MPRGPGEKMAAQRSLLVLLAQLLLLGRAGALPPLPWQTPSPPTPPANEWDRSAKGAAKALAADLLAQALADNTVVIFSRQARARGRREVRTRARARLLQPPGAPQFFSRYNALNAG